MLHRRCKIKGNMNNADKADSSVCAEQTVSSVPKPNSNSNSNSSSVSRESLLRKVNQLQEELRKTQNEKIKAEKKLDSLLFLVKRSWNGDDSASNYLSKIVGLQSEKEANGFNKKSKRAGRNWLQLSLGLLKRHNQRKDDNKIQQSQMSHMQQRYRYMEYVLRDHHRQMTQFAQDMIEEFNFSYYDNWEHLSRNKDERKHHVGTRRIKSANVYNPRKGSSSVDVDISQLSFKDLLIQPAPAVPRVTFTPINQKSINSKINPRCLQRPTSAFSPQKHPMKNRNRPKTAALPGSNRRKKATNNPSSAKMSVKSPSHHSPVSVPPYLTEDAEALNYFNEFWLKRQEMEPRANGVCYTPGNLTKNRVTFAPKMVQLQESDDIKGPTLLHSKLNNNKSTLQLQIRLGIPEASRVN